MTGISGVTLEQEKELLVTAFRNDNPDLYKQYRDMLNFNEYTDRADTEQIPPDYRNGIMKRPIASALWT